MRIPCYVKQSRHGIYFFRIVVPKTLRELFDGKLEIKRSLHTRNQREALRMARPLALQAHEIFERLGACMSKSEPSIADILAKADKGELRDLRATQTVTLLNGEQHSYTIQTDSDSPAEIAAFVRLEEKKQAKLDAAVQRYQERAADVPEAMLAYQPGQAAEMARLKEELAARDRDMARIAVQTLAAPTPQVAPGAAPQPATQSSSFDPANRISVRWDEYYQQAAGAKWTTSRSIKGNKRKFELFMKCWGKDGDVRAIEREDINKFIRYLLEDKEGEAGDRLGDDGLGHRSVDNHVDVVAGFLQWARDKGYFPVDVRLPTDGQRLFKKKALKKAAGLANPIHTIGQLQTLFDSKTFCPVEAHHFWPPLIALFTGARRREVAQLLLSDFYVKDGIQAMSINILEDEDKSVKSAAAIRVIPLHPELINLGLLDYLQDVKKLGLGPEVFPGIGTNSDGEKGNAIGNFWRGHMKKLGLFNSRSPTFHSFRATALQELKDRGVELEMRCQLAGHEIEHVSEGYNPNKFSLQRLMEDGMPKLRYEGLDLSGLRYRKGQFDEANRISTKARIRREAVISRKIAVKAEKDKADMLARKKALAAEVAATKQ
jgi:integrase